MRHDPRIPEPGLTSLPWLVALLVATAVLLGARIAWGDCGGDCDYNRNRCIKTCRLDYDASKECDRKCDDKHSECKAKCPKNRCEERWERDMSERSNGDHGILDANARYWRCIGSANISVSNDRNYEACISCRDEQCPKKFNCRDPWCGKGKDPCEEERKKRFGPVAGAEGPGCGKPPLPPCQPKPKPKPAALRQRV